MSNSIESNTTNNSENLNTNNFITCDLLDDNPSCQVCLPNIESKRFYNFGGIDKFSGEIVTVKCFEDNSRVKELLNSDGKDTLGNGKVLVVDGGGSMRCALMGDMIALSAIKNGWAGVVIYGCVRDVDDIATMQFGVKAIGCIPRKSNRRGEGQRDIEICFGDMTLLSGMYLYSDNNGIIVSQQPLI